MTRIIAGTARGRRLRVPGTVTRPTSDRVREALFASLDHALGGFEGIRVLDLYAGSGALGLEAVSRGASEAVLVERDRRAAAVTRANVDLVGLSGVRVVTADVGSFLAGSPSPFDLVLVDPPYAIPSKAVDDVLARLRAGWLADDAIVVVERSVRSEDPTWPAGLVAQRRSAYGETCLWYGRTAPDREDP